MKTVFSKLFLVLISLALNFGVFVISYKNLSFPYLHEAQRMENAPHIFTYVLGAFFVCAVVSTITTFYIARKSA
mgnify:CR=1 FL=1